VAQPQALPAEEWEDIEWELQSQAPAAAGKTYNQIPARPPRSGLVAKATDIVKFPQTWPHVASQDDFSNQSIQFNNLDFRLFVAVELEIATSQDIQQGERAGRLRLLKNLAYLNGAHQWDIIKKIYVAIVRKIELGSLHWGSCFLNDIQWILTNHTVTSHPQPSRQTTITQAQPRNSPLYCLEFNRGACSFKEAHFGIIRGKQEWLQHICSRCIRKDKQQAAHAATECNSD
jgi:hypothetical protein